MGYDYIYIRERFTSSRRKLSIFVGRNIAEMSAGELIVRWRRVGVPVFLSTTVFVPFAKWRNAVKRTPACDRVDGFRDVTRRVVGHSLRFIKASVVEGTASGRVSVNGTLVTKQGTRFDRF